MTGSLLWTMLAADCSVNNNLSGTGYGNITSFPDQLAQLKKRLISMRSTVNSIIRIKNEIEENVLATLEKFKAMQDIPVAGLDFQYIEKRRD